MRLILFLLIGFSGAANADRKAVFIIMDGIPADVIERVATPTLDAISSQGGYTRAWTGGEIGGASESPTISAVGYQSLLTGTWANKHNVYDNKVENPDYSYWDIFRIFKSQRPESKTAVFSTWEDNRTKLLGDGLAAAGGRKLDYFVDGLELDEERFPHDDEAQYILEIDREVSGQAATFIRQYGPDLTWVYLQYTDNVGHDHGDSPEQVEAVKEADRQVGEIWQAVQSRRDEDWMFLVTTDHGRDGNSGKNHGGQTERERTIWISTNAKKLNNGFRNQPAIVDILPSILDYLAVDIPVEVAEKLDGRSFLD